MPLAKQLKCETCQTTRWKKASERELQIIAKIAQTDRAQIIGFEWCENCSEVTEQFLVAVGNVQKFENSD